MTAVDLRCPACNAHVVSGAEWCTLCYHDLRPAPEPVEEPVFVVAQRAQAPRLPQDGPGSPTAPSDATEDMTDEQRKDADAAAAAAMMLAQLAAESGMPLRGVAGNFESAGAKVALIAGGSILIIAVLVGIMLLLGAVLPEEWLNAGG